MRLSLSCFLLSSAAIVSAIPSEFVERSSPSSTVPACPTASIDPSSLHIGACLAIGTCYYNGNQQGCYTSGCLEDNLGGICSCVPDVQAVIEAQTAKGQSEWPVKCPY